MSSNLNPMKYLSKDLLNKPIPFDVWLQGHIHINGDDINISDSTGQVKVLGCDNKDINNGDYCSVIGVAVKTTDSPEINAVKSIKISSIHKLSWELEVREAQLVLQGLVAPKL